MIDLKLNSSIIMVLKDGNIYIFDKLQLLVNQEFANFERLGVWKNH